MDVHSSILEGMDFSAHVYTMDISWILQPGRLVALGSLRYRYAQRVVARWTDFRFMTPWSICSIWPRKVEHKRSEKQVLSVSKTKTGFLQSALRFHTAIPL